MADPTVVGTPQKLASGGSYTRGSGSNRLVLVIGVSKHATAVSLTNVVYNGITRTPSVSQTDAGGTNRVGAAICVFKESELPAGAATVTSTWSSTPDDQALFCYTIQDANQTTPVRVSNSATGDAIDPTPGLTFTAALAAIAVGDLCIGGVALRANVGGGFGDIVSNNGFTEDFDTDLPTTAGAASSAHKTAASTTETYSVTIASDSSYAAVAVAIAPAAGAATISTATPSGTLGTAGSATIGCTTTDSSGTLYAVVDSAANISGITAAQIKLGQNKNSVAAVGAANAAVSTSTPSAVVPGLTANTLYSYAEVQNNGADSNVLTGTFTTAVMPPLLFVKRIYYVDQSIIQI